MQAMDARKLSPEGQADLRRRVVAAVEAGMSQQEAGRVFGISRRAVGVWVRAHRLNGPEALNPHRRGRNPGEQFALSRRQQSELLQELSRHAPDELGLVSPVWSRRVLADFIAARYGLHLSTTTVGHYLTRWGLLGSARRAPQPESMLISWHRPVPLFVGDALVPEAENLDVLVAQSARGAAFFLCVCPPYTVEALQDFVVRLEGVEGGSPSFTVGMWPADQAKLLRAWRSAQAGRSVRG